MELTVYLLGITAQDVAECMVLCRPCSRVFNYLLYSLIPTLSQLLCGSPFHQEPI